MKLLALLLLPFTAFAQTVTLAPVPANPESADEWFLSISDASSVKLEPIGGTCVDWIKQGAAPGGAGGTSVVPALGDQNNDGICLTTVTVPGSLTDTRTDFDGPAFSGAQVTLGAVTKSLVLANGTWSATFTSGPPIPPVPPVVTYGTELIWIPVTRHVDGSPATIASYRVSWGTTAGAYPSSALVQATTYAVAGLAAGTWFFTVTAIDAAGAESARSNVVSNTVGGTPMDCVVSAWAQGLPQPAICPTSGQQTRTDTRTVLTPASNGGAACPALSQSTPLTCIPVDPCVAAPLAVPTALSWPTARTGARALRWTSPSIIVGVNYSWPVGQKQTAVWTDNRGCSVSAQH